MGIALRRSRTPLSLCSHARNNTLRAGRCSGATQTGTGTGLPMIVVRAAGSILRTSSRQRRLSTTTQAALRSTSLTQDLARALHPRW